MSFSFFKYKAKSAGELVHQTREALSVLHDKAAAKDSMPPKVLEGLEKSLVSIRQILEGEYPDWTEEMLISAANEAYRSDFISLMALRMGKLDWEARKQCIQIWAGLLQYEEDKREPRGVAYVENHPEILDDLIEGYTTKDMAPVAGSMLREALKYEPLARCILESPKFTRLFTFVDVPNFDISSDAFLTLKEALKRHRVVVCNYLTANFVKFFECYEMLLKSPSYVTRRQALKLLGEVLLDRANVTVMLRYIADAHNLRVIMVLLKDQSRTIQFEAFHVFKVFVANPNKPEPILKLLSRNKERLLEFLDDFQTDKEDEQFEEEKELLTREIEMLPTIPPSDAR
eukprot:TRINITY_DN3007_c0_g1_i1.p1 TRINITY_DN3007_c0_g1~~TRINITY_DN3007_c0_g1_i1.p1  ORF type:complete len:344 (+),score=59.88 TRINITY_DN3007_c0_g1_i1:485-1516(+)